jgi:hypothetical protein
LRKLATFFELTNGCHAAAKEILPARPTARIEDLPLEIDKFSLAEPRQNVADEYV